MLTRGHPIGYSQTSCFGGPLLWLPRVDRQDQGLSFTELLVIAPKCTPALLFWQILRLRTKLVKPLTSLGTRV